MFVFNVKLNRTRIFKFILAIMAIICIALVGMGIVKMINSNNEIQKSNSTCMPTNEVAYLTDENYTNILKEVHENLDTYIGQKICYTGYVYRVPELEDNQFILARDMQIENTNQTVIVGFLCSLQNAQEFENYSWIKITGSIEKGYYLGDIPCVNISEIEKTSKPENCVVPPPRDTFIQTSVIY